MTRIATFATFLMLTAGALAQTAKPTEATAKTLASLQGSWTITSINGQSLAVNGQVNERGTIKLDPSKKPMAIDLVITEGDDGGKTQLGVIEITGDTLTGKLNTPGVQERPKDFAAQEGFFVFVAKKAK